jgi:glutamyl-tRNA(Gln) amidotransferase subunit E
VRAIRLKGLAGTLSHPTQPDHTFAHELAGRIRVIAGLDQQPIFMHDERWPEYGGALGELRRLKTKLDCDDDDGLVVVWGPEGDTVTAAEEIEKRYREATEGIPPETRQPFEDGRTDFERILPGPDRMYPDTDSPPTRVVRDRVERLEAALPAPPLVREERYGAAGVPTPTIHYLIRRDAAALVDLVTGGSEGNGDPLPLRRACIFFGERMKGWRRSGIAVDAVPAVRWCELFEILERQPVLWDAIAVIVRRVADAPEQNVGDAIANLDFGAPDATWRDEVVTAVQERRGEYHGLTEAARRRWHLGQALRTLRGRVPVADVATVVDGALAVTRPEGGDA